MGEGGRNTPTLSPFPPIPWYAFHTSSCNPEIPVNHSVNGKPQSATLILAIVWFMMSEHTLLYQEIMGKILKSEQFFQAQNSNIDLFQTFRTLKKTSVPQLIKHVISSSWHQMHSLTKTFLARNISLAFAIKTPEVSPTLWRRVGVSNQQPFSRQHKSPTQIDPHYSSTIVGIKNQAVGGQHQHNYFKCPTLHTVSKFMTSNHPPCDFVGQDTAAAGAVSVRHDQFVKCHERNWKNLMKE